MEKMFQQNPTKHTKQELALFSQYAEYFEKSKLSTTLKLLNFPKYVRRQDVSRFLAKNELFKKQLDIPGVIIECGCYAGGGIMTYAQLSSIYEPHNHQRKIVGFDTFCGFPSTSKKDKTTEANYKQGSLHIDDEIIAELHLGINLYDLNRALGHLDKVELIAGDATKTIPEYIKDNPHLIISLLYLDFDLYEPTKAALECFINRMPKGAILAFDELNTKNFPGETLALLETIGINNIRLKKTQFDPYISFAIL